MKQLPPSAWHDWEHLMRHGWQISNISGCEVKFLKGRNPSKPYVWSFIDRNGQKYVCAKEHSQPGPCREEAIAFLGLLEQMQKVE